MSSLVAKVLESSGKLAKENIVLKVAELKRKLESIKFEVQENLKNRYLEFYPQSIAVEKLINRVTEIMSDYDILHSKVEKEIKPLMENSVAEFNNVIDDLKSIKTLKENISNIILLHQHLESAKQAISQSSYLNAALCLHNFDNVFKSMDSGTRNNIAILCAIRAEYFETKEDILYHLKNAWKQKLVINYVMEGKNKRRVTLTINKNRDEDEELLKSLKLLNCLKDVLKEFSKQFLNMICKTLILNIVKVNVDDSSFILTITIVNEQSPMPSEVLNTIKSVMIFLHENLFNLPVATVENGVTITAMSEFGRTIEEDFCNLIIEECLKTAVPNQTKLLERFHKEMVEAENFCNELQSMGFFTSSENKILKFIRNVDILPVNKMIQNILSRARALMKQSLHQTVVVGTDMSATEVEASHDLNDMARTKSHLSKSTFLFPRCHISSSVKDLIHLLLEVKDEAKNIGRTDCHRLYYAARNICELYCCVVPTYHKEEIENIPQQTGIFHNNCMYLAHHLCTLGNFYECELQMDVQMTFVDLVQEIRKLGTEAFLSQMRHQKQQLLQILQEKAYQNTVAEAGVINKSEKVIRQCLYQLQLLKKVWCEILPTDVYFKAIGTLLNTSFEEIIQRVLAMEDIAEDTAAQMDSTFDIIVKNGPDLFKVPTADKSTVVHLYVKKWFKIQELQLVLRASMREIVDRWASGKGPLATHFRAENVKHLIRALFQNTERRAAALSKIK